MYRSEYLANLSLATQKRSPQRKSYRYYQKPIQLPMVRPGFVVALMFATMILIGVKV